MGTFAGRHNLSSGISQREPDCPYTGRWLNPYSFTLSKWGKSSATEPRNPHCIQVPQRILIHSIKYEVPPTMFADRAEKRVGNSLEDGREGGVGNTAACLLLQVHGVRGQERKGLSQCHQVCNVWDVRGYWAGSSGFQKVCLQKEKEMSLDTWIRALYPRGQSYPPDQLWSESPEQSYLSPVGPSNLQEVEFPLKSYIFNLIANDIWDR